MKAKFTRCKACGQTLEKQDKFCPNCGAKNKKPIFKKWWFWLIVVSILASLGKNGSATGSEPIIQTPPTTQAPTTEPTSELSTEATTVPVEKEETISNAEATDLVETMIELSISDKFDYYTIEANDTGITLSVATNGVAQDVVAAKYSGYDENYQPWVEAKESFTYLCNSIYDSAVEFGMKDPIITVIVLNDQNHDNILLGITNGVIMYDVMAS